MNRKIILPLLLLFIFGGVVVYRMYNEKTPTASGREADTSIDATALFQAFSQDEAAAGKMYNDKVIQVNGVVRDIGRSVNGPVNVTLETGDAMGGVVCEFAAEAAPTWQKGQTVTLKGFCAGFNLDVILQRCAAVE